MQKIRNIVWPLIAALFIGLLTISFFPFLQGVETSNPGLSQQTIVAAYIAFAFGFFIPFSFLKIPATLIHEAGHALSSSLLGGKVKYIKVEIDESGLTWSETKHGRFGAFLVCASGPLANSVFFIFTANLIVHNRSQYWIGFTLLAIILITISTVRSFWGWMTAIFISIILIQSLIKSIQVSSSTDTFSNIGIWTQSSINLAIIFTAYTAAIELHYAWRMRNVRSRTQDEYRVSKALGISPKIGGWLLFFTNLLFVLFAFSLALGWENLLSPGKLL